MQEFGMGCHDGQDDYGQEYGLGISIGDIFGKVIETGRKVLSDVINPYSPMDDPYGPFIDTGVDIAADVPEIRERIEAEARNEAIKKYIVPAGIAMTAIVFLARR